MTKAGEPQRWIEETAKRRDTDDCIEWPFYVHPSGYGIYQTRTVNSLICEKAHGPAPSDKPFSLHSCHNRSCGNPLHLRWGSAKENTEDMMVADRHPHLIGYR